MTFIDNMYLTMDDASISHGACLSEPTFDEIGYWSEVKLDIVKKYAAAYSKIMSRQSAIRRHLYIDGFAGAGVHISKTTREFVGGSPTNALLVAPPCNPARVSAANRARMDAVWGDRSWRDATYPTELDLFGKVERKASNEAVAEAFRRRLREKGGFNYVPQPMPMRNSKGAVVYYLFFASPNETGGRIVDDIFAKHRHRGIP